jgi:hypothetical protein
MHREATANPVETQDYWQSFQSRNKNSRMMQGIYWIQTPMIAVLLPDDMIKNGFKLSSFHQPA